VNTPPPDLLLGRAMVVGAATVAVLYGVRTLRRGRAQFDRVDQVGNSKFVSSWLVEMGYWAMQPFARLLRALGMSANVITWWSLVFGLMAAVSLGFGWFGAAAVLGLFSVVSDALDGIVARMLGTSSEAGEVFDAAVDRYTEFAMLAGAVVLYRNQLPWMIVALAAMHGSFMISYSTAKAEAMGIAPPKGAMRRHERAIYWVTGTSFAALSVRFLEVPPRVAQPLGIPFLFALTMIAVVANASAVRRFWLIYLAVRARQKAQPTAGAEGAHLEEEHHEKGHLEKAS